MEVLSFSGPCKPAFLTFSVHICSKQKFQKSSRFFKGLKKTPHAATFMLKILRHNNICAWNSVRAGSSRVSFICHQSNKMQLHGIYLINSEVDTFLAMLISVKDIFTNLHNNIFKAFPILAKMPNLTSEKSKYV